MDLSDKQKEAVSREGEKFNKMQMGYLRNRVAELAAEVAALKEAHDSTEDGQSDT